MAAAFESLAKVKELQERLVTRMGNMRKRAEKGIGQAIAVAEVNGGLAGWGYANERWGEAPKDDPTGLREVKIMGIPADLTAGLALVGMSMFGGLGKYDEHGLNLGNASTGAFSYRLGAEAGRRAAAKAAQTTTQGAPPQMTTGQRGVHGGRVHHVEYASP
jgi:hypothetical protein